MIPVENWVIEFEKWPIHKHNQTNMYCSFSPKLLWDIHAIPMHNQPNLYCSQFCKIMPYSQYIFNLITLLHIFLVPTFNRISHNVQHMVPSYHKIVLHFITQYVTRFK